MPKTIEIKELKSTCIAENAIFYQLDAKQEVKVFNLNDVILSTIKNLTTEYYELCGQYPEHFFEGEAFYKFVWNKIKYPNKKMIYSYALMFEDYTELEEPK